jgi:glycosyltransferase involved in cell wall biosynthesis
VKRIVMLGSRRDVRGGVSAMVNVCFGHGLFERWEARYLPTHCDGGKARKAALAAASLARFVALLAAGRVALVHAHIASGASFWRKLAFLAPARAAGVPYILHVHAGDFAEYHARIPPPARALLRWLYGGAHAVIALSPSWEPAMLGAVPGARVEVVPNPVSIPPWRPRPAPAEPTALYLGVVRPEKGVFELLEAWPRVMKAVRHARLVIAGSGEVDRARARADELGIAAAVEFPGWVGAGDKARLLERATALVLPSHFEALPMAVLEGMAAGLPIVATHVGSIPDAVGPDAGVLVPPGDVTGLARALVAVLGNDRRRIAMGTAARARARALYSADVVVPEIERLWAEAVPTAKRTTGMARACP